MGDWRTDFMGKQWITDSLIVFLRSLESIPSRSYLITDHIPSINLWSLYNDLCCGQIYVFSVFILSEIFLMNFYDNFSTGISNSSGAYAGAIYATARLSISVCLHKSTTTRCVRQVLLEPKVIIARAMNIAFFSSWFLYFNSLFGNFLISLNLTNKSSILMHLPTMHSHTISFI